MKVLSIESEVWCDIVQKYDGSQSGERTASRTLVYNSPEAPG
jgi:hypothetical protein